ncbi:MAG TPA: lactate utilization protein [Terriglobia bacterium]|nr:lactate utilization protein [Terriglobia bacterium]
MARREEMIRRIRKALGRPPDGRFVTEGSSQLPTTPLTGILPAIPPEELLSKFEAELTKVAGVAHRANNRQGLEEILKTILFETKAKCVVASRNPLLAELNLEPLLRAWGTSISVWPAFGAEGDPASGDASPKAFAEASLAATVGITGADFVLAETGSLVVTSRTEGAQLASLAPPVHVALYRRSQLVGSLDEVLERLQVAEPHAESGDRAIGRSGEHRNTRTDVPLSPDHESTGPPDGAEEGSNRWGGGQVPGRSVVFITGTSRTADIEQILIRGVHGPGEVHAILVEDKCFW